MLYYTLSRSPVLSRFRSLPFSFSLPVAPSLYASHIYDTPPFWNWPGRRLYHPHRYLTGAYATAWTRGAQDNTKDPGRTQAIVTVKHLAAYSVDNYHGPDQPSKAEAGSDRYTFNAVVDDYNFFDSYAPPFEMAVRDANVRGIMCT